jgi:hypothetical protein
MRVMGRMAALAAVVGSFVVVGSAQAAAPSIVNGGSATSGNASWVEGQAGTQGTGNRRVTATFIVTHDAGKRITGVAFDKNYDGTDNTGSVALSSVTPEYLGVGGSGSGANRLASSLVRVSFDPGDPGGFSCPAFSDGTRRRDLPLRFAVADDSGVRSPSVAITYHWVEEDGCTNTTGTDDYPVLESVSQSASSAAPGANVNFTFTCDDADSTGNNDRCDYIRWHWRRLNDGTTSGEVEHDAEDNTSRTFGVSFPSRGIYVVEAYLCGEDSCDDSTSFRWRLGTVIVDDNQAPSGSIDFSGANVVQGSPDSVNAGDAASAVPTTSDPNGGVVQVIGWDLDGNGSYELTDFSTPFLSGGNLAWNPVTASHAVSTATAGVKTVNAEMYDNGVADASGNDRNRATMTAQLRVNAKPVATNTSATTNEDNAVTFTLPASDADNLPAGLTYDVAQPAHGTVSVSGNQATYTPAANYHGTDSFTFTAKDGPVADQAWATSNGATVSLTVDPVNDAPSAGDLTLTTAEDTALPLTLVATDVDGDSLSYAISQPPAHGSLSCPTTSCTYTPAANYHGADQFEYTVDDGHGGTDVGTVDVTVTAENDAPVADDQSVSTDEDTAVTFALTASDVDGDALSITPAGPSHGAVSCTGASCTYTPDADYHGSDSFGYSADDGHGGSDTATVSIAVASVNDAPSAGDLSVTTDEDTPLSVGLVATDVDGDGLTYTISGQPTHGTLSGTAPALTYTPDADYHGPDSFGYQVDDGNGGTDTAAVSITVTAVNDAPVASDQAVTTPEDTAVTFTADASDVDGDTLSASASDPAHGDAACTGMSCTYTPDADYNGSDSFTLTVTDGNGGSDTSTVSVGVTPVNDAPVAHDEHWFATEDTQFNWVVVASDVDGDPLSATVTTQPAHGSITCGAGMACHYTPDADYNGPDQGQITISDGVASVVMTVSFTVSAVNDAPVVSNTTASTAEDMAVLIGIPATDVDGTDTLTATVDTAPAHGSVTCAGTDCTYPPDADYNGTDEFTVTVSDGNGGTASGSVGVTITPVNDAPVAPDVMVATDEDTQLAIAMDATDVDGDALTFAAATQPAHGSVICPGDGSTCVYAPAGDYNGPDSFTYTVSDGNGGADAGTIDVVVNPVNDPPVGGDVPVSIPEDSSISLGVPVSDVDGDTLTVTVTGAPAHGTASCTTAGFCSYAPDANYNGTDAFAYTVSDGNGGTDTGTVSITVTPVNDPPVAQDAGIDIDEDTSGGVQIAATDVDGDSLDYVISSGAIHGIPHCEPDGECSYTPDADYNGPDVFQVTVSDGNGGSDTALVHVTVRPVNDAPTAGDASVTVAEDSSAAFALPTGDVDGDPVTVSVTGDPSHGTASCTASGVCSYSPAADYNGSDAFTYTADDGHGGTDTGTASITVTPVNDAPVAANQTISTDEDTAVSFAPDATDVDGDDLGASVSDQPLHGTATCDPEGCTYTPAADFNGPDVFEITVSDGNGGSDTALVHVNVAAVNDAPVADDRSVSTAEDEAVTFGVHATDVDGDELSASVSDGPAHGSASCTGLSCTYTPAADYNGADSFTVTVSDGHGGSDEAAIGVEVSAVNDKPVAQDAALTTAEDTPGEVDVHATDVDSPELSYGVLDQPAHGTAACTAAGHCTYTPAANYNGSDSFTYAVDDGHEDGTDVGTITVTVTAVNDAPVATDGSISATEDTPKPFTLHGTDVDGDGLAFTITSPPVHGTVECSEASCVYTPAADYFGPDGIGFRADDGHGGTADATITVDVAAVNDAPTAQDVTVTTAEDTPADFALLGGDVDDTMLTYSIVSGPAHGSLSCTGAACHYVPAADYHGSDAVTYKVTDAAGASATGHVAITVTSVSDATKLSVPPVIKVTSLPLKLTVLFQATLTRDDGTPVAGRTITWIAGGQRVCSAKTNAQGFASCGWSILGLVPVQVILGNGYTAVFDGDEDYVASSATGKLIG